MEMHDVWTKLLNAWKWGRSLPARQLRKYSRPKHLHFDNYFRSYRPCIFRTTALHACTLHCLSLTWSQTELNTNTGELGPQLALHNYCICYAGARVFWCGDIALKSDLYRINFLTMWWIYQFKWNKFQLFCLFFMKIFILFLKIILVFITKI